MLLKCFILHVTTTIWHHDRADGPRPIASNAGGRRR